MRKETRRLLVLVASFFFSEPVVTMSAACAADEFDEVVSAQLASLDASDALSSAWAACVAEAEAKSKSNGHGTSRKISWGGL